jgi:hypothetical protein
VNFLSTGFIAVLCLLLLSVVGNMKGRDHLGDPSVDGRIILRWIFRKWDVEVWIGSSWLEGRDSLRALVTAVTNFWVP